MNRLKQERARRATVPRAASIVARLRTFGILKLIGMMIGLGLVMGFMSIYLIPTAVRVGVPAPMADKLPYLGFACGALVGLSAAVSHAAMLALQIGLAIPLILFALLGSVLSIVLGLMGTIAVLDILLTVGAVGMVFLLIIVGLGKLSERK